MGKRARRKQRERPNGGYLSTEQLREQGLAIDVPFETPDGGTLQYDDGLTFREAYPELFDPNERGDDPSA